MLQQVAPHIYHALHHVLNMLNVWC